MITLHFHLQPQYKYELFHINFTLSRCTGRYQLNKLTSLPMCGFTHVAQLVEHRTGIAEVTGSNPVEALFFFQASSFQLLKLENLLRWSLFTFMVKDSWYSTSKYDDSWWCSSDLDGVNRTKLCFICYEWWEKHVKSAFWTCLFTANKVRTFRTCQLCVYVSLIYVKTCGAC